MVASCSMYGVTLWMMKYGSGDCMTFRKLGEEPILKA